MKEKNEEDPLEKLVRLTKLMKKENIKVAPKGPPKASNKWRGSAPKFAPQTPKSTEVVQAGGMDVDPSLREQYDNWRKDKLEEEAHRRLQSERKAKAAAEARAAMKKAADAAEAEDQKGLK